MDVEIAAVLLRKPSVEPKETTNDVIKMKFGRIQKDNWTVAFQQSDREGKKVQKCLFSLPNKHLYSTSCLNYVLGITKQCKANDATDKKCLANMIKWYIIVRNTLIGSMPKRFKV
ncbi:unnamed protein product [Lactuca saligna]|uniref:Uncharacterized protein n=1 Tax=Lactuca saligna TaxID=75948 RepID=A0AA35Y643_LACSI|nr:unnamed protein product [Lactuca saligna]